MKKPDNWSTLKLRNFIQPQVQSEKQAHLGSRSVTHETKR